MMVDMRFTLMEFQKEQRINIELIGEGKIWTVGPYFGRVYVKDS